MSARRPPLSRWLAWPAALILLVCPLSADDPRSSLRMVEGQVISLTEAPGEGGLAIVMAQLAAPVEDARSWQLLLAPRPALADIGFAVEPGDLLRARVFPTAVGPAKVHKVLNLTRRKMVRMRTLSGIPLWDGTGAWQGGECRGLQAVGPESGARPDPGP